MEDNILLEMHMNMHQLLLENEELKRKLQINKRIISQLEEALMSENVFDHSTIKKEKKDNMASSLADKIFCKIFSKYNSNTDN